MIRSCGKQLNAFDKSIRIVPTISPSSKLFCHDLSSCNKACWVECRFRNPQSKLQKLFSKWALSWFARTFSKSLDIAGNMLIGLKSLADWLSGIFGTGVISASFNLSGNVQGRIWEIYVGTQNRVRKKNFRGRFHVAEGVPHFRRRANQ